MTDTATPDDTKGVMIMAETATEHKTRGNTRAAKNAAEAEMAAQMAAEDRAVTQFPNPAEPVDPEAAKVRAPRVLKNRPPLDLSLLEVSEATPESLRRHKRTKGERDPEQQYIDKIVTAAHERWIAAGRPDNWLQANGLDLAVPEDLYDTLKYRINRAGDHLGVAIRLGDAITEDGKTRNTLVVKDRVSKAVREAEAATAAAIDAGAGRETPENPDAAEGE